MHELPSTGVVVKDTPLPNSEGQLSPAYATRLFFASFEHSQGFPQLQRNFFRLMHNLHPAWQITDATKEDIRAMVTPKISKHLEHSEDENPGNTEKVVFHPYIAYPDRIANEISSRLNDIQEDFNYEGEFMPTDSLIFSIRKEIGKQDDLHTIGRGGRPRRNVDPSNPKNDPRFSYFKYYVIDGNSTEIPEFDEIYGLVRQRHQEDVKQREERKAELAKMGF